MILSCAKQVFESLLSEQSGVKLFYVEEDEMETVDYFLPGEIPSHWNNGDTSAAYVRVWQNQSRNVKLLLQQQYVHTVQLLQSCYN